MIPLAVALAVTATFTLPLGGYLLGARAADEARAPSSMLGSRSSSPDRLLRRLLHHSMPSRASSRRPLPRSSRSARESSSATCATPSRSARPSVMPSATRPARRCAACPRRSRRRHPTRSSSSDIVKSMSSLVAQRRDRARYARSSASGGGRGSPRSRSEAAASVSSPAGRHDHEGGFASVVLSDASGPSPRASPRATSMGRPARSSWTLAERSTRAGTRVPSRAWCWTRAIG